MTGTSVDVVYNVVGLVTACQHGVSEVYADVFEL